MEVYDRKAVITCRNKLRERSNTDRISVLMSEGNPLRKITLGYLHEGREMRITLTKKEAEQFKNELNQWIQEE